MDTEKIEIGDLVELSTEKLVYGGAAIAHKEGKTIFVYGSLPDEKVLARIVRKRKGIFYAQTEEVIEPSEKRIQPACPHFGLCGGCIWQHIPYKYQLAYKQDILSETVKKISKIYDFEIEPIIPSPEEFGYRNKMEFTFGSDDRGVYLGLHKRWKFDELTPVAKDCLLIPEELRKIVAFVENMAQGEAPYDPRTGKGYIRFLTLRWSFFERKALIGITVTNLIEKEIYKFWFEALSKEFPKNIAGGFITINPAGSSSQGKYIHLFGEKRIKEKIGDKIYTISALSFFQTNPKAAKSLFDIVLEYAEPQSNDTIWDLYCGAGTIGIYISEKVKSVLGIESEEVSIEDAWINVELNNVKNNHFIHGRVNTVLAQLLKDNIAPDTIIVDPPRAGLAKKVIHKIVSFAPKKVVYVSCNPSTLARDAAEFAKYDYILKKARPIDMFPQTYHIESVALIVKK